jgi:hypothetical protein
MDASFAACLLCGAGGLVAGLFRVVGHAVEDGVDNVFALLRRDEEEAVEHFVERAFAPGHALGRAAGIAGGLPRHSPPTDSGLKHFIAETSLAWS